MSDKDNPFGGMGGQYSTNVSYGSGGPPTPTNGPAAPLVVRDVTTASFAADVIQESRKLPVLVDLIWWSFFA